MGDTMTTMLIATFLRDWFGFPDGSVLTNLVAAAVWVAPTYLLALRHLHCCERGCFRPGTVKIAGTVHKKCKKHARASGHTH